MLKESTMMKGNLCIYKQMFHRRFFKKNLGNAPDLSQLILVSILPCAQPILLVEMDPGDPVSVT